MSSYIFRSTVSHHLCNNSSPFSDGGAEDVTGEGSVKEGSDRRCESSGVCCRKRSHGFAALWSKSDSCRKMLRPGQPIVTNFWNAAVL